MVGKGLEGKSGRAFKRNEVIKMMLLIELFQFDVISIKLFFLHINVFSGILCHHSPFQWNSLNEISSQRITLHRIAIKYWIFFFSFDWIDIDCNIVGWTDAEYWKSNTKYCGCLYEWMNSLTILFCWNYSSRSIPDAFTYYYYYSTGGTVCFSIQFNWFWRW